MNKIIILSLICAIFASNSYAQSITYVCGDFTGKRFDFKDESYTPEESSDSITKQNNTFILKNGKVHAVVGVDYKDNKTAWDRAVTEAIAGDYQGMITAKGINYISAIIPTETTSELYTFHSNGLVTMNIAYSIRNAFPDNPKAPYASNKFFYAKCDMIRGK